MKAVEQAPAERIIRIVAAPVIIQKIRTPILSKKKEEEFLKKKFNNLAEKRKGVYGGSLSGSFSTCGPA